MTELYEWASMNMTTPAAPKALEEHRDSIKLAKIQAGYTWTITCHRRHGQSWEDVLNVVNEIDTALEVKYSQRPSLDSCVNRRR